MMTPLRVFISTLLCWVIVCSFLERVSGFFDEARLLIICLACE